MKLVFIKIVLIGFILPVFVFGQKKKSGAKQNVTLEDVWQKYVFFPQSAGELRWMKDDNFYSELTDDAALLKIAVTDEKKIDTLIQPNELKPIDKMSPIKASDYQFSADESKVLFLTESKNIYRWSKTHIVYVFDLKTRKLQLIHEGKMIGNPIFSLDANKLGFTFENNLYFSDLASESTPIQVTKDGEKNKIINGSTDWVYEEELELVRAFDWSADSKKLAYLRFDETEVPEYSMDTYNGLYPKSVKFKYPKAGEKNAVVKGFVFDINAKTSLPVDLGKETDQYIPRLKWTPLSSQLAILRLNRIQNKLELLMVEGTTGNSKVVLTEESDTYIEVSDETWTFLKDGNSFLWTSEKDGYKHLYQYDITGKLIRQITKGNWEISKFHGLDEQNGILYYSGTEDSPLERYLYSIKIDGSDKKKLTTAIGMHDDELSKNFRYFIDHHSNSATPPVHSLFTTKGDLVRTFENNSNLLQKVQQYNISPKTFFQFTTGGGAKLNGWMIKPQDFKEKKKYPVIMFVYGGPGNQQVQNEWSAMDFFWYQTLTQQGYIVACIDNRGTGGRGAQFKKCTYKNLGKLETEDQIEGAKYLGSLKYVEKTRIGIWGWSFGGYMTSLCLTKGADYFKAGVAVAPVTNWRFYDSIYTERFLRTPQDNAKGYDDNSPINFTDKMKGKYLLIHGTADDNVHFQNSAEMVNALIKSNVQFQSFYYPNRNHGIYGGNSRMHIYKMMADFWKNNL